MVKQIQLLLVAICAFGSLVVAQNGTKLAVGTPTDREPVDCGNQYKFKCASCRNIAICAGGTTPVNVRSCSSSPTTPYCVKDACTTELPAGTICEAEFRCSGPGYFPNPDDCSKYFFCDKANGDAFEYSCGATRVYNSKDKSCVAKVKATDCQIIDCSKTANGFVRYAPHLAFYAFCSESAVGKETIVYKCDDENTSEFNLQTLGCEFKCPGEGRYPSPGVCTSFYECSKSGTILIPQLWACPSGYRFDEYLKRCVAGTCQL